MAAQAAAVVPDMSEYITRAEAQQEIGKLVKEQLDTFQAQREAIEEQSRRLEEQSREARDNAGKLTIEIDRVLKENKKQCDDQITQQVGTLRTDVQNAVQAVDEKIAAMEALHKAQTLESTVAHDDADLKLVQHIENMKELEGKLRLYADGVESNLNSVKDEVGRTQAEILRTQAGIRQLIENARSDGSSGLQRPSQERDRQVFDPRDYKIEVLPSSLNLGIWKKWRHEVEIYVDTIGPSWKGVKLLLQQARHSPTALQPSEFKTFEQALEATVVRARQANSGLEPVEEFFDYAAKGSILYRMLVPKLNLELSTEFRNSSPDNGFELWRLLNRKLDPPRADFAFHWTNDLRKHARTNCSDFNQTVKFIAMLEGTRREFAAETGEILDVVVLGEILGAAMDEDTMGRLEDAGTDIKDYETVRVYAENRHVKNASRAAGKSIPKDGDKMVYGVEAAPSQPPPTTCTGGCGGCALHPAPPGLDSAAAAYDPWADAQDPWSCQPCAPEAQEGMWQLDAFGQKGKGQKGKGERGPMACYNCLGLAHPERLCPSQRGAGQAQIGGRCKNCNGFGHDTPVCTSKGGGKYSVPPPGKGKGKDGGKPWGKGKGNGQSQ